MDFELLVGVFGSLELIWRLGASRFSLDKVGVSKVLHECIVGSVVVWDVGFGVLYRLLGFILYCRNYADGTSETSELQVDPKASSPVKGVGFRV